MSESAALNQQPDDPRAKRPIDLAEVRRSAITVARQQVARDGAGRLTLDGVAHAVGFSPEVLAKTFDSEQDLLMAIAADDLAALAKSMRGSTPSPAPGSNELMRHVETLESSFGNVIDRHQRAVRQRNGMNSWVEQCVQDLQQQVASSDRAFAEMRAEPKAAPPESKSRAAPQAPAP